MPVAKTAVIVPVAAAPPTGLGCLVIVAQHHGLHLSTEQLIREHRLSGREPSMPELLKCAQAAGLEAKVVRLDWAGLVHLKKALPAVIRLKNGGSLVLLRLEGEDNAVRVVVRDPNAADDALLRIDQVRLEGAWSGDVILLKRTYEFADEGQPFSIGQIAALIFRERRMVRDIAICAVVLGFLALTPVLFWRLMSDRVLSSKALSTFSVLCLAMAVLIVFEAIFGYLRRLLVLHLTTRLDVKLATDMFEKVLNLPIDFFERTQIGLIARDMNEMWKIRTFLMGQLFGTVLEFGHASRVPARYVLFQSNVDGGSAGVCRYDCCLAYRYVAGVPTAEHGGYGGGRRAQLVAGSNAPRHSHGQIAGARHTPAPPMGCYCSAHCQVTFC